MARIFMKPFTYADLQALASEVAGPPKPFSISAPLAPWHLRHAYPRPACRGPLYDLRRCPRCGAVGAIGYGYPRQAGWWCGCSPPWHDAASWLALLPPRPTGPPLTPGVRALARYRIICLESPVGKLEKRTKVCRGCMDLCALSMRDAFARGVKA